MKLHLGCGARNFGEDWIHIDGSGRDEGADQRIPGQFSHIAHYDIERLPFEENSCDLLYSSHTIEYFDRDQIQDLLAEWRRVLKPGGTLRVAVPDFSATCTLYREGKWVLDNLLGPLYGKRRVNSELTNYHKTVYDQCSLSRVLRDAGFRKVRKWDWRKVEHGHIDDYSQSYCPHMDKENGVQRVPKPGVHKIIKQV